MGSGVPVPVHVYEAEVEGNHAPDFVEAAVRLVVVLDHLAVSAVAERSVGRVLAVAQLVVPALRHIELHGPASGDVGVAGAVAPRIVQRDAARAPVVHLALLQIRIVREPP